MFNVLRKISFKYIISMFTKICLNLLYNVNFLHQNLAQQNERFACLCLKLNHKYHIAIKWEQFITAIATFCLKNAHPAQIGKVIAWLKM